MSPIALATSYSRAGFSLFKVNGKLPVVKAWQKSEYVMPWDMEDTFGSWDKNFGMALPDDLLIIDNDPRNHLEGDNPFKRVIEDMGIDARSFPHVITGGGGVHLYMRIPKGTKITKNPTNPELKSKPNKRGEIYHGVDFLAQGCYVVIAGSIHPETKRTYELKGDLSDIPQAPEALLKFLAKAPNTKLKKGDLDDCQDENPQVVKRYAEILTSTAPAVEGSSGDATLFQVCCKGRDLGLSPSKVYELVSEQYNPRCIPPWDGGDLKTKVENAFEYAQGSKGQDTAQSDFDPIPTKDVNKGRQIRWQKDVMNRMLPSLNNTVNYFVIEGSPFVGSLCYNEFSGKTVYLKKLPWHTKKDRKPDSLGIEWTDDDTVRMKHWLSYEKAFNPSRTILEEAIIEVSHMNKIHPVREYLQKLTWDGKPRLSKFLIDFCGAEDDEFGYTQAVTRVTLLQAVYRAFRPGCKADTVLVLEGMQGCGKSGLVGILAGDWLGVPYIDPKSKDTIDAMRGRWIIEMAEMDVPRKTDAEALKAFISKQTDSIRPAYGRRTIDLPRTCIFIGTINPDATGEYFHDATGNRRFYPVPIRQVDFKEVQAVRDQLWAETVDAYWNGEKCYITDPEVLEHALEQQARRQSTDAWQDKISSYVWGAKQEVFTTDEVWMAVGGASVSTMSGSQSRRIANCLREAGYVRVKKRLEGKLRWAFVKKNQGMSGILDL